METDYQVHAAPGDLVDEVRDLIERHFSQSLDDYLALPDEVFRRDVLAGQELINARDFARRFVAARLDVLAETLGGGEIAHQSQVYLRATRPKAGVQEAVGLHRESFYGPPEVRHCYNIWVPIKGVSVDSGLGYIPGSAAIPTEAMQLESIPEPSSGVARFSDGHRIGLLYSPKRILSGLDTADIRVMKVGTREFSLFSGELIHGNATNTSDEIRYSVDFRVISTRHIATNKAHFASGGDYFVPYAAGPAPPPA